MDKFFIFFALLFTTNIRANSHKTTCSKNGTLIHFTNGLDIDHTQAYNSTLKLEDLSKPLLDRIDKNYLKQDHVIFDTLHFYHIEGAENDSFKKFVDWLNTYVFYIQNYAKVQLGQSISEQKAIELLQDLNQQTSIFKNPPKDRIALYNEIAKEAAKRLAEKNLELSLSNQEFSASKMVEAYIDTLQERKRILAVPHGEGSIIQNIAYSLTFDPSYKDQFGRSGDPAYKKYISTIPIAPTNHNLGPYRTFQHDSYYSDMFLEYPAPESNIKTAIPLGATKPYHNFIDVYLANEIKGPTLNDDQYFGTLGGLIEAAEKLVSDCGVPPKANFTFLSYSNTQPSPNPLKYSLDASTSTDDDTAPENDDNNSEYPDYDIKDFKWTIDEGKNTEVELSGIKIDHLFTEGLHTIKLIVVDEEGNESEPLTKTITAQNKAPVASFNHTTNNLALNLDASDSKDEDGSLKTYNWKILDSEMAQLTSSSSSSKTFSYTFTENGNYDIELTVIDNNGKPSLPLVKTITIGKQGCYDPFGNLYPGKTHFNPDGSIGGYVANTASVSADVMLYPGALICGNSQLTGRIGVAAIIENSSITNTQNGLPTDRINIGQSLVSDSRISGNFMTIGGSEIRNSSINGDGHFIDQNNKFTNAEINGFYIRIHSSEITSAKVERLTNSNVWLFISASKIYADVNSTDSGLPQLPIVINSGSIINAPVTGWTLWIQNQSVINSAINGSCFNMLRNELFPPLTSDGGCKP